MTRPLAVLLMFVLMAPAALAQPFFDAPWRTFQTGTPETGHYAYALAAADLNGDRLPDAITAQNFHDPGLRVVLNQGAAEGRPAIFEDNGTLYPLSRGAWDVVAADLDGDGDIDLAAPNTDYNYVGNTVAVFRNNGNGTFQTPQSFPAGNVPYAITAVDLDGDGDRDLAVTNYGYIGQGTTISVLRNNGSGAFAAPVAYTVPSGPARIDAGDLDGDGDADLAVAHDDSRGSLLFNNGNGTFGPAVPYDFNGSLASSNGLALLDPDGDGDLDVLFAGYYDQSADDGRLVFLRNNGSGVFTTELIPYGLPYRNVATDLVAADFDGDGRDDVVGAQQYEAGFVVFRDDDADSFLAGELYASVFRGGESSGAAASAVGDLDGDGDPDVLTVGRIRRLLSVHENSGNGVFPERPIHGRGNSHLVLDLGDVDGDGNLDAATSHGGAASSDVLVLRNAGDGTFTESYRTPLGRYGFAKLRDLDGDGKLDLLFVSGPTSPPYDFFTAHGNGDGTFGAVARHALDACGLGHPGAFDLDEDGDLDVVNTEQSGCMGGGGDRVFVSLNNGNGTFQPAFVVPAGLFPYNLAAGEFDEDGNLDLATASQGISAVVFGNGDGTFRQPALWLPSGELSANILALDLNADGHLDLATLRDYSPNGTAGNESELVLLFGNGDGEFSVAAYPEHLTQDFREWLASGDVDGDGDPDIVTGGVNDAVVFLNDGAGSLAYSGRYGIGAGAYSLHYADVTGDGRGDLVALATLDSPPSGSDSGLVVVPGREGQPAPVTVSAEPVNPPIDIPPGGGSFQFTVTLTNTTAQSQTFQAWTAVTGPVSRSPVIGPKTLTLAPNTTVTGTVTQQVPGSTPAGAYTYIVNVGVFPAPVTASASFPFTKQGSAP